MSLYIMLSMKEIVYNTNGKRTFVFRKVSEKNIYSVTLKWMGLLSLALSMSLCSPLILTLGGGNEGNNGNEGDASSAERDTDKDQVLNQDDRCPEGAQNWISNRNNDKDGDGCRDEDEDIDDDGNGLIEISSLDMLNHIRYNLFGTSYVDNTSGNLGTSSGCGGKNGIISCRGYELTRDLDFNDSGSYDIDSDNQRLWCPGRGTLTDVNECNNRLAEGWRPIGSRLSFNTEFNTIFDGRNYSITNLYIRRGDFEIGLFGVNNLNAQIRNIGLKNANVYATSDNNLNVGGLLGLNQAGGVVTGSYSLNGLINGNDGDDRIGMLVGDNRGTVTNSYSLNGMIHGGNGNDSIGGLIGSSITGQAQVKNSYSSSILSGDSGEDQIGGLVGDISLESIIENSYVQGSTILNAGSDSDIDTLGYLVGMNGFSGILTGSIINSYYDDGITINRTVNMPPATGDDSPVTLEGDSRLTGDLQCSTSPAESETSLPEGCTDTSANGTYLGWPTSIWFFGLSSEYPRHL